MTLFDMAVPTSAGLELFPMEGAIAAEADCSEERRLMVMKEKRDYILCLPVDSDKVLKIPRMPGKAMTTILKVV